MSSLLTPSRLRPILLPAAWGWLLLVVAVTFWRVWDIPARMPETNEIATRHLLLFPVSMLLFLLLSWLRKHFDDDAASGPRAFPRWRASLALWLLVFLHPVSCGLYPAAVNLDTRTVEMISQAVNAMRAGMPRTEVEKAILELNAALPITMQTDDETHRQAEQDVIRYLAEQDPAARRRLWPALSRATLVFIPWSARPGEEPDRNAREQTFLRRGRASSDIGVDKIAIRYGPAFLVEQIVYSSNRQLLMERQPCTVHAIVPVPPEGASFPYPCPSP